MKMQYQIDAITFDNGRRAWDEYELLIREWFYTTGDTRNRYELAFRILRIEWLLEVGVSRLPDTAIIAAARQTFMSRYKWDESRRRQCWREDYKRFSSKVVTRANVIRWYRFATANPDSLARTGNYRMPLPPVIL